MKLLFLDIDGVLISGAHMDTLNEQGKSWFKVFDPKCVEAFNELVAITGAKVVVSSTWRYHYETIQELAEALTSQGVTAEIVAFTPRIYGPDAFSKNREDEILEFLQSSTPYFGVQWLAVDDHKFMKIKQDHVVQTDFQYGLTKKDVAVAASKWARQEVKLTNGVTR